VCVAICGIGSKDRGDDAFGPYIVDHVRESERVRKIDCGLYPENYVNKILELSPELVIFFDTVAQEEGKPVMLKDDEIADKMPISVSTHNLSFGAIYELLKENGVENIFFFGVPALSYAQYSSEIKEIADRVISVINDIDKTMGFSIMSFYEALSEQIR
jgi:hydrogenase 3 maturation protease